MRKQTSACEESEWIFQRYGKSRSLLEAGWLFSRSICSLEFVSLVCQIRVEGKVCLFTDTSVSLSVSWIEVESKVYFFTEPLICQRGVEGKVCLFTDTSASLSVSWSVSWIEVESKVYFFTEPSICQRRVETSLPGRQPVMKGWKSRAAFHKLVSRNGLKFNYVRLICFCGKKRSLEFVSFQRKQKKCWVLSTHYE